MRSLKCAFAYNKMREKVKNLIDIGKILLKIFNWAKKNGHYSEFFFRGDVGIMTYATIINDEWSAVNQHLLIKGWSKIFKRVLTYNS